MCAGREREREREQQGRMETCVFQLTSSSPALPASEWLQIATLVIFPLGGTEEQFDQKRLIHMTREMQPSVFVSPECSVDVEKVTKCLSLPTGMHSVILGACKFVIEPPKIQTESILAQLIPPPTGDTVAFSYRR